MLNIDCFGLSSDESNLVSKPLLRPNHLIDVEDIVIRLTTERLVVLLLGDKTEREQALLTEALGSHAGENVLFIRIGAGDELIPCA